VRIDNVKLLSARVENGDGFDIVNSRNVTIANSFVRSDDDCIAPKAMGAAGGQAVENLLVENCILWTDRAHVWRIGCESRAETMRHFTFRNIDVLHFSDLWTPDEVPFCISLEPGEAMPQENILFEDIRIRTSGQRGFIDVRPKVTQWAESPQPGRIQNVIFRSVSFSGPTGAVPGRVRLSGPGARHNVSNVRFENVRRNGELLLRGSPGVEVLGFVDNVSFAAIPNPRPEGSSPVAAWKGVTVRETPRHRLHALIEARQPRGVIVAEGGKEGPWKAAIEQLQAGLQKALGTTLPVAQESRGAPAIIIGDSPQAQKAGLSSERVPPGGFELRTAERQILLVGNGAGIQRGVEVLLAHFTNT
jgi:hypothetical protein